LFVNAGILYVMSPSNPGNVSRAHKIFTNTLIGLIIILVAYLLIDTIMKALYADPGAKWGPWNEFLCKGDDQSHKYCVPKLTAANLGTAPVPSPSATSTGTGNTGSGRGSGVQCAPGNTACSVAALTALGYTPKQANVMSCIAMTESSGVASTPPYNQTHPGSNSSACGTFQIVGKTWRSAARSIPGCQDFSMCRNGACNAKVALKLVQGSQYSSWLCPNCNSKAMGCVRKFGG
jgi:Lysozyme like domain